ncbi:hypothetical protein L1049_006509 [Liquidambar formosana]|uniref:UspA domain-containing protein n=1 Tax=Liquidambar formosana TaxID=63359 RepID=A0AAP0WUB0_LIQFO
MEDNKKVVMVAIEESDCSHYALKWTLESLCNSISESHLIIFTVLPIADYSYIYASTMGAAPPDLIASVQENQKKVAVALLEKAKKICADHGVIAAETIVESGDPKAVICEAVEKLKVELLVLGSHGRGALKRAFLGSVSNHCVQNAKCPVLVVRKPE